MVELLKQFATAREHHQQRAWEHGGPTLLKDHENARPSPRQGVVPRPTSSASTGRLEPVRFRSREPWPHTSLQRRGGDQEPAGRSGRVGTLDQSQEGDQGLVTGEGGMADQGAVALPYTRGTRTPVSSRWAPSSQAGRSASYPFWPRNCCL